MPSRLSTGPNGRADDGVDIPADWVTQTPRERPLVFWEFCEHLMGAGGGRYAAHPTLAFALLNIKQREQSLACTSFGLKQLPGDAPLDKDAVCALLQADSDQIGRLARSVTAYTKNIPGTPAYWWARRTDVRTDVGSLTQHKHFVDNELPIGFHSASLAEFHMPGLHLVLHEYLLLTGNTEDAAVVEHLRTRVGRVPAGATTTVHNVLLRYPSVINEYFVSRTQAWFNIVLKEGMGIKDWWYRFEFAKSRGAIHFHSLLWDLSRAQRFHGSLDKLANASSFKEFEDILNGPVRAAVGDANAVDDDVDDDADDHDAHDSPLVKTLESILPDIFPGMTAEHPAGRVRTESAVSCTTPWYTARLQAAEGALEVAQRNNIVAGATDVPPTEVGNVDLWPTHEGRGPAPSNMCLRCRLYEVPEDEEQVDLVDFANRTRLHECSSYCLRQTTIGEGDDKHTSVSCRMHFGDENPLVPARTDGKPVAKSASVVSIKGILYLELPRDHPRFVQGPLQLSRIYGANMDLQPVISIMNDVPSVPEGLNVLGFIEMLEASFQECDLNDPEAKKAMEDLLREKTVLNSDEYCERLIDYVVSYACKGEVSSTEALDMFKQICTSSLDGSTPIASLAQRLNMKLIRSKELPKSEAVFDLSRLPYFSSSKSTLNVNLNVGHRDVEDGGEDGDVTLVVGSVRLNHFDKYLAARDAGQIGPSICFSSFLQQNGCVPNYLHGHLRARWPLTEEYCSTMLMLYKPVSAHSELQGAYETSVDAFRAWVEDEDSTVPPGIERALLRAFKASYYGKSKSQRGSGNRRGGAGRGAAHGNSQVPETPPDPNEPPRDDTGDDIDIGGLDMDDLVQQAPLGFDPASEPGADTPRHLYGSSLVDLAACTTNLATEYYARIGGFDLPIAPDGTFVDPVSCIGNAGQSMLLTAYLDFLEGKGTRGDGIQNLRGVVTGVAGTGKSFCMALLRSLALLSTGARGAYFAVAPTGAAAGGIGASTADRMLKFKRALTAYKDVSDPLLLAALQNKHAAAILGMADEFSMWGQNMHGHYVRRLDDVLDHGSAASVQDAVVPQYGNLPAHLHFGDPKQLEPVLDPSLSAPAGSSAIRRVGKAAWDAINMHFHLDTPVRQNADGDFVQHLQHLREGNAHGDVDFWASRRIMFLTAAEKNSFSDDTTMHATCFNKDKHRLNQEYIAAKRNTVIIKSTCVGTHAVALDHTKGGMAKKIPVTSYISIGMMIKLVANLIPELGLFNNARGFVRDWFYIDGTLGYDPENQSRIPIVMVEFPGFTGPALTEGLACAGKSTWVPIAPMQQRCDCGACYRHGLPLVCAKADSIHSLQGVTVGDNKPIKRLIIHWTQQAESLWAGIFYVAASRAMESHNIALAFNITQSDLTKIGTGEKWLKQDTETNRLVTRASDFRVQMAELREEIWHTQDESRWGSAYDLKQKLVRFIDRTEAAYGLPHQQVNAHPARLEHAPQEVKTAALACLSQWRQSLAALGP